MMTTDNCILVIFGASGDLTKRKLIPAMYDLKKRNQLPEKYIIVGVGRSDYNDDSFREKQKNEIEDSETGFEFLNHLFYQQVDTSSVEDYKNLDNKLKELDKLFEIGGNYIFYLATPPRLYSVIPAHLSFYGLNKEDFGWRRLVVEKPFGVNLDSAKQLNMDILSHFKEHQLYRIDHYLGKETVQNILVTRFGNGIFEPLWNRNFIDHVEITAAESIGVEKRGGYYDNSGALKDMIQNHLLQLTGLVAMEPPASFESNAIRNETLKVFQSLRPFDKENLDKQYIKGQYISSKIKGETVPGYREEEGVDPESRTETFAAIKFYIDNWRWGGVPFYIRTGKRLPTRVSEIVIHFKATPHRLFKKAFGTMDNFNKLVIRIQPDEGLLLKFGMKMPGAGFEIKEANMSFRYAELSNDQLVSAYERLLLDCIHGDSTLYARGDAVEACWDFIQPLLDYNQSDNPPKIYGYPAGSWGPENADDLIEGNDTSWRYPCKNLTNDGSFCEL
ncbi:MAG: glucose-6-phosphate dehydrogenase [Spirochaetaceae bacterium]|nr:glucose-6-phosphate dehydrogenase [Spirochaetaceae bacterium]